MAKQYYSVLTDYGTQMIASVIARKQPLQIMQMAVGDGNGQPTTPNSRNTRLVREVHRANISAISVDPRNNKQLIFELTIPENVGGFWIREMGIFDNQNRLVAYANCPDSFKPELTSGSGKVQVVRMILLVSSSDAVTLKVDDSVIFVTRGQLTPKKITATTKNAVDETGHSHEIDKASTKQAGIVQLTNDTNSDSETLGLTAKAGKTLKALIDALTRNLANYIPNSKKSNSVTSPSSDTVATSAAAKMAYDKGVEANENANQRAMQGKLGSRNLNDVTVPGIYGQGYSNLATSDRNYPENRGGMLIVHNDSGNEAHQIYTVYDNGHQYSRGKDTSKRWLNWVRIDAVDKANRVGDEIKMKTVDFNKADDYTYSGFYRPNSSKLNNLALSSLMMHITHPSYTTNAHARGIGFSYGSCNGNQAWDLFTTAFDANGAYLGQKQIMTELGGSFTGNVTAPNLTATGIINIAHNNWERIRATLPDGGYWRWEVNPASATDPRFNYVYRSASGEQRHLAFPTLAKNETVAYQSWVIDSTVKKDWLVGVPIPWMLSSVPAGFLAMQGQAFDKSRYPILAQRYPSGRLPDMRGEFIRGWDNGRGMDSGRALLSSQDDAFQDHYHALPTSNGNDEKTDAGISHVISDNNTSTIPQGGFYDVNNTRYAKGNNTGINSANITRTYSILRGAFRDWHSDKGLIAPKAAPKETRPRNIAFQYICLAA